MNGESQRITETDLACFFSAFAFLMIVISVRMSSELIRIVETSDGWALLRFEVNSRSAWSVSGFASAKPQIADENTQ